MTNVMTKAWEIARKGAKKFGGKVKEYFSKALELAWKIVKVKKVEKYEGLKFHVRAVNSTFKTDEMFMSSEEARNFIGFTEEKFDFEMSHIDPSRADFWECEVDGIICNVYVMKKYIHEM